MDSLVIDDDAVEVEKDGLDHSFLRKSWQDAENSTTNHKVTKTRRNTENEANGPS
jgi:hypothetical protein